MLPVIMLLGGAAIAGLKVYGMGRMLSSFVGNDSERLHPVVDDNEENPQVLLLNVREAGQLLLRMNGHEEEGVPGLRTSKEIRLKGLTNKLRAIDGQQAAEHKKRLRQLKGYELENEIFRRGEERAENRKVLSSLTDQLALCDRERYG